MDIDFDTSGPNVITKFDMACGLAGTYMFSFTACCHHASYAGLVQEVMQRQLDEHIEQIRRDAYEQGWQDKAKRRKKRDFFGWGFSVTKMP